MGQAHDETNNVADLLAKKAIYGDDLDKLLEKAIKLEKEKDKQQSLRVIIDIQRKLDDVRKEKKHNRSYRVDYEIKVGDLVMLETHHLSSGNKLTTHKLYPKQIRPYRVVKK